MICWQQVLLCCVDVTDGIKLTLSSWSLVPVMLWFRGGSKQYSRRKITLIRMLLFALSNLNIYL